MKTKYVVITPFRDEETFIEQTIKSILGQTIPPSRWILVDDNSSDSSAKILERYAKEVPYITIIKMEAGTVRTPGQGVMRAFNCGVRALDVTDYDFVVKLDADLSFPKDTFQSLFEAFESDPSLGIASSMIYEMRNAKRVPMKRNIRDHTYGPMKVYRRACFDLISPIEEIKAWDLLDNIKANVLGYKTKIILDVEASHLKPMESAAGSKVENYLKGYYAGFLRYDYLFAFGKGIKIIFDRPYILGAMHFFYGYLYNIAWRRDFYPDAKITSFIRQQQRKRIKGYFIPRNEL